MASADPTPASEGTRGDRTRRAILTAATARLRTAGFDATTLGDVAADAGVSGPTVAFHFGSKLGLLAAVISDHYAALIEQMDAVIDAAASPMDRLVAFTGFWLRENADHFDLYAVFFAHGLMRHTDTEPGRALRENNARITRRFERLVDDLKADGTIRADVPTRLVRDAFFGTTEHVLRGRPRRKAELAQAADALLDLVLRGAGAAPPAPTADRLSAIEAKLDRLLSTTSTDQEPTA